MKIMPTVIFLFPIYFSLYFPKEKCLYLLFFFGTGILESFSFVGKRNEMRERIPKYPSSAERKGNNAKIKWSKYFYFVP